MSRGPLSAEERELFEDSVYVQLGDGAIVIALDDALREALKERDKLSDALNLVAQFPQSEVEARLRAALLDFARACEEIRSWHDSQRNSREFLEYRLVNAPLTRHADLLGALRKGES